MSLGACLSALVASGCDDPVRVVPAPDRRRFREEVYPALLRDCSFVACHGDPRRPLFVPGPGRARLDPELPVLDPPTEAEVDRAYDRARALLLAENDEPPPLLHKATADAAHQGRDAQGRNVYEDPESPGLLAIAAWAAGDAEQDTEAAP